MCSVCNQPDTVQHYIFDCLKHTRERNTLQEKLEVDILTPSVIFCNKDNVIYLLLEYVKATNMLTTL